MTTLEQLPEFLSRLKGYGEGDKLKKAAMQEVETILKELNMSRRQFLRDAIGLGYKIPTITTLGNWISCKHWPEADNVDILIEALEAILRSKGKYGVPKEELHEASAIYHSDLGHFQRAVQDVDQAISALADTIAWIDLSEFPPTNIVLPSSFISITRQHGIERLSILFDIHNKELEKKTFPASTLHSLIVSGSSIVLAHHLQEIGEPTRAWEVADEGTDALEEILARKPELKEKIVFGEEDRTWAEHEVLGFVRRGTSLKNMARQTYNSLEKQKLFNLASKSFRVALEKAEALSEEPKYRWKPAILRDIATMLIRMGGKSSNYSDAEQLIRLASRQFENMSFQDDPILYYVCQMNLARALIPQGKLDEASAAFDEARQAEAYAQKNKEIFTIPGPLHRSIFLQAEALYYSEKTRSEGRNSSERREMKELWKERLVENLKLAQSSGLKDQGQQVRSAIFEADKEVRQDIIDELDL